MFLKKIVSFKNGVLNFKNIKVLCKTIKPVSCVNNFSSNNIQSPTPEQGEIQKRPTPEQGEIQKRPTPEQGEIQKRPEMDVTMNVSIKEGDKTTNYEVKSVGNSYTELGEAPHWHRANQSLYYVDLNAGKLLRYDFKNKEVYKCKLPEDSSTFVIPVDGKDNQFVVGSKRNVELVIWDGLSERACISRTLFTVQNDDKKFEENRFNDGKCDETGRLIAGTMFAGGNEFEKKQGELYSYDGKEVKTLLSSLGISNGLTWNKEGDVFYYIDMADYNVREFKYDKKTGDISNPKVVFNWKKTETLQHVLIPDGMTIDADGNIYVAVFNGGTVYKIDPRTGKILLEIKFPCKQITSCAFGGPSMNILYVTTSSKFDEPPPAGMLFQVTGLCAEGLPMSSFKMNT